MEGWRQSKLGRRDQPCPTKKQKNPLDSDRPSHGRHAFPRTRLRRFGVSDARKQRETAISGGWSLFRNWSNIWFAMHVTSKPAVVGIFCLVCTIFLGALYEYPRYVTGSFPVIGAMEFLGVPLLSDVPSAKMPPVAVEQFLEGDFSIVRDLRALPAPVLRGLTGKDGSSLAMTNPWGIILESDLVAPGIPGARLIFAGISREKVTAQVTVSRYTGSSARSRSPRC
jgi:hypothetical protein